MRDGSNQSCPVETIHELSLQGATKFRNKYRIESTRLKNWDYSSDGAYFITICTQNREHRFGDIIDGVLQETESARICRECWLDLPNHYPNCRLDEFVIMPNHVHGVIMIENDNRVDIGNDCVVFDDIVIGVETIHELSLQTESRGTRRKMMIPKIIGRFKMQTAKRINLHQNTLGIPFWQPRYHDRIIRDDAELNRIRVYIQNNPINWEQDKDHEPV